MIESSRQRLNIKHRIPQFISKIYSILQENEFENIISWSSSHSEIQIKNIKALEQKVLPIYFRHKNIQSFIRQLNMYRFSKVNKFNNENHHIFFKNDLFRKGDQQALSSIQRKKQGRHSPEISNHDQDCSTKQSYHEFIKQNIQELQTQIQKIRKSHPQLDIEMNKLMEISKNIVGEDKMEEFPGNQKIFQHFETIRQFKMPSFKYFDENYSILNDMKDDDQDI